jgi:hypothetical protein
VPKTPAGPIREVSFADEMVTVERVATQGPDPEVHMDEWVHSRTVDIPVEDPSVISPTAGVTAAAPTTVVASGSSSQTRVVTSTSAAAPAPLPVPLTATRTRPPGQQPVFPVQVRGPLIPLGRGQARATVCRPVARHVQAPHPVPQAPIRPIGA